MTIQTIKRTPKIQLAYRLEQHQNTDNNRSGVVFLPGFKSDMMGSKACFLHDWCLDNQIDYLRFDYSGHGESEGDFEEGTIGSWYKDSEFLIESLMLKPQILVGSSMGGWISLLLAVRRPELVKGLVLIAPAPDFTREIKDQLVQSGQLDLLEEKGYVETPSGYEEPYIFTKQLLEDGECHCLLDDKIPYDGPVRILQGKQDNSVPWQKAQLINELLSSQDTQVDFVEDGDHSLSRDQDLEILEKRVSELV